VLRVVTPEEKSQLEAVGGGVRVDVPVFVMVGLAGGVFVLTTGV